jgi:hypothetical protein
VALQSAKDENNIVVTAYEVRLMALHRDCRIQHVIARKLGKGKKRGRRSKQLLDYLKEKRKLKDEALDVTLWRTRF